MPEDGTPEWYYTAAGERMGPVAWVALKARADEGKLDPRLDWVWRSGTTDWVTAGQVDGLFVRRETASYSGVLSNPYVTPMIIQDDDERLRSSGIWPGVRRRGYLAGTILFPFVISFFLTFFLAGGVDPQLTQQGSAVLTSIVSLYVTLQRLPNLGMSRWWILGGFVPFLNLWIGYRLFACPAGYAQTRKLDGIGIGLAIFYWLMVVLGAVLVAFVIYYLMHAGGNPEIRRIIDAAMAKGHASPPH
jgi:hypothetical protein